VTSDDPSDVSVPSGSGQRGRKGASIVIALFAVACLAVALIATAAADAQLGRKPTSAQRAAAAALAVAERWRTWPAGRVFPARLSYDTALLTTEAATRVTIGSEDGCSAAVEAGVAALARRDQCQAALRATYLDQLQGVVYTVGVLAFPSARLAAAFWSGLRASAPSAMPLRALAEPGTASARFTNAARQASTARRGGPFVVLTVAGYADGEPAGPGQEERASIFAPAAQLADEILGPLATPVTVDCASRFWSC
jgi:hypothetical protein